MTEKKSAKKCAASSEIVFLFTNCFFFLVFRPCGCAEVANSDLIKNARQKLGPQAIADYYILVSSSEFVFFGPRLLMQVSFKQRVCLLLISLH